MSHLRLAFEYCRETNSYFNHGVPCELNFEAGFHYLQRTITAVSDTGGAAVWVVDYTLFAGTLGIANMFFHEGIGFKYNLVSHLFYLSIRRRL